MITEKHYIAFVSIVTNFEATSIEMCGAKPGTFVGAKPLNTSYWVHCGKPVDTACRVN
jgi:hypothetical protein